MGDHTNYRLSIKITAPRLRRSYHRMVRKLPAINLSFHSVRQHPTCCLSGLSTETRPRPWIDYTNNYEFHTEFILKSHTFCTSLNVFQTCRTNSSFVIVDNKYGRKHWYFGGYSTSRGYHQEKPFTHCLQKRGAVVQWWVVCRPDFGTGGPNSNLSMVIFVQYSS